MMTIFRKIQNTLFRKGSKNKGEISVVDTIIPSKNVKGVFDDNFFIDTEGSWFDKTWFDKIETESED